MSAVNPLRPGVFVIMRYKKLMFVGEVLDLYKKVSRRHGSVDESSSVSGLSYFSLRVYLPLGLVSLSNHRNLHIY